MKIELTAENITKWKKALNWYMKMRTKLENYADTCNDSDWLEMFDGQTPQDVFKDYCTQD